MKAVQGAIATCQFELSRILSFQRIAVSSVLALFPPAMLFLLVSFSKFGDAPAIQYPQFIATMFIFMVCLLSSLLWATPNVYSELEGKSWVFTACRPRGRISMVIGKYLASLIFSFGVCLVAVTLCVAITQIWTGSLRDYIDTWLNMVLIFFFACATYGAIFSLIGTLFYRRAMVIAAGFTLVSEAILANIPAIISRFTMRFHLQFTAMHAFGDFMPVSKEEIYQHYFLPDDTSIWYHIGCMALTIVVALGIGCYVVVSREFLTSDET